LDSSCNFGHFSYDSFISRDPNWHKCCTPKERVAAMNEKEKQEYLEKYHQEKEKVSFFPDIL
jgi:hypothetical protein